MTRGVGFISLALYVITGCILGFLGMIFTIPLPTLELVTIGAGIGAAQWFLVLLGYIWPKMTYKTLNMGLGVFAFLSLGVFLPALGITILLVNHKR